MMTVRERVEHLRMAELMTFQPKTDEPTPPPEDVPAERGEARPHVVAERELCLLIVQHVDIANQPAVFGAIAALVSALAAPAAGEAAPDKQLNGWRELGQEMERILTFMTIRQREDLCPDWFIPRLLEMLTASPGRRAPAQEPT